MILQRENNFFQNLKGQCADTVEVSFGPRIIGGADAPTQAFESGLVRIEASKCYSNADPSELLRISGQPAFKKAAFPTLKNITTPSENVSWESTSAPPIGQSYYCYTSVDLVKTSERASQVSFLTLNRRDLSAPVYFREAFVSARKMGNQTLYYVLSYVRSNKLNFVQKQFASRYIEDVQKQVFTKLENSLQSSNPK